MFAVVATELPGNDVQPIAGSKRRLRVGVARSVERDRRDAGRENDASPPAEDRLRVYDGSVPLRDDPRRLDPETAVCAPRGTERQTLGRLSGLPTSEHRCRGAVETDDATPRRLRCLPDVDLGAAATGLGRRSGPIESSAPVDCHSIRRPSSVCVAAIPSGRGFSKENVRGAFDEIVAFQPTASPFPTFWIVTSIETDRQPDVHHPGVVDQDVDPAEAFHGGVDQRFGLSAIGEIGDEAGRLDATGPQLLRPLVDAIGRGCHGDGCAFPPQDLCSRESDAAGST
jgi:hypothetical protein